MSTRKPAAPMRARTHSLASVGEASGTAIVDSPSENRNQGGGEYNAAAALASSIRAGERTSAPALLMLLRGNQTRGGNMRQTMLRSAAMALALATGACAV